MRIIELRHVPMDWRYREVPNWAYSADLETYKRYCRWLANHLRKGDFPMNESQSLYVNQLQDNSRSSLAFTIGDAMGLLIWKRDELENHARQGTPYSEIEKQDLELWQKDYNSDPVTLEPFEDYKTPEQDYVRICKETKEADAFQGQLSFADIGVRPLLAFAVKQCESEDEAEAVIRVFYDTYNESASK